MRDSLVSPPTTPGSDTELPTLEISGSSREIGRAIGKTFGEQIRHGFEARAGWWKELKAFADAQQSNVYSTFLAAAKKHTPAAVEELEGWAEGCGLPFRDLVIYNLKAEYSALRDKHKASSCTGVQPGCSTVARVAPGGKQVVWVHNEDGNKADLGRMFLLKVRPDGGRPAFTSVCYPGVLAGNAPWTTDRGIVTTSNFIYTKEVRLGVGRYFLARHAIEAKTLDDALKICTHPERAYSFHLLMASRKEQRVVSLEVTPGRHSQQELSEGIFVHTNHLIHDSMLKEEQEQKYVGSSSMSRWKVLTKWREAHAKSFGEVGAPQIIEALSSHEGKPYSPCRHPAGKVEGATLLTAVFVLPSEEMRILKGQPCGGHAHDYPLPKQVVFIN